MADVTVISHVNDAINGKNDAIARALETIGLVSERYAKGYAPVDTGRLRNSISHQSVPDEEAVYVGTNVEYAPYQEFGTKYQAGTPFLRPAIENHLQEYKNIALDCLKS